MLYTNELSRVRGAPPPDLQKHLLSVLAHPREQVKEVTRLDWCGSGVEPLTRRVRVSSLALQRQIIFKNLLKNQAQ